MALKTRAISFVWGLAEATFFFFVPDIWLTRIAITNIKEAIINAFIALIGALIGGVIIYLLGSLFFDQMKQFLNHVPAITENMITQAGVQMTEEHPVKAILMAGFTGLPFKIYAVWSGHLSISFIGFILVSAFARIVRFLAFIFIAYGAKNLLVPYISSKGLIVIHAAVWIAFYIFYFYKLGF